MGCRGVPESCRKEGLWDWGLGGFDLVDFLWVFGSGGQWGRVGLEKTWEIRTLGRWGSYREREGLGGFEEKT